MKKIIYYAWNHEDPEYSLITFDKKETRYYDYVDYEEVGDNRYFVVVNNDEDGYIVGIGNDWQKIVSDIKNVIRDVVREVKNDESIDFIELTNNETGYTSFYYTGYREDLDFDNKSEDEIVDEIFESMLDNFRDSEVDRDSSSQRHIYDIEKDELIY